MREHTGSRQLRERQRVSCRLDTWSCAGLMGQHYPSSRCGGGGGESRSSGQATPQRRTPAHQPRLMMLARMNARQ